MSKSEQKRICIQSDCAVRDELRQQLEAKDKIIERFYRDFKGLAKTEIDMVSEIIEIKTCNAELVKSLSLIADYLENNYNDVDGVKECRRVADKYEALKGVE